MKIKHEIVFKLSSKEPNKRTITRSRKRKRTKSNKKRSSNFLNNFVAEQYKEYKRKESMNNFIKMKLYNEIGIPPLAREQNKQTATLDHRKSNLQNVKYSSNISKTSKINSKQ